MDETDETKFEDMLQKAIEQMLNSDNSREFGEYFETYYSKRKAQWASCYRKSSGINTNMYVESFHKVLKYIYFKGKTNGRVDKWFLLRAFKYCLSMIETKLLIV